MRAVFYMSQLIEGRKKKELSGKVRGLPREYN